MKNQLVMALEDKGLSAEEIKGILKAVEETSFKFRPADQLLQTINQPEMKNELVKALEGKGIPADVVAGILKEIDQVIMAKARVAQQNMKEIDQVIMAKVPEVTQDTTGKSPTHVEPTSPSFRQAAVAILEKNGFSAEDIKGILKAVEQATVGGLKPDQNPRSDQSIFIQQSLYHKEFIEVATVGGKKIHADIYQKEASMEDFRHENVEGQIKINPPEKQLVKEGLQKELLEQPKNTQQPEKKNVFSAAMRGAENKQLIVNDKEINAQQPGKVITATAQDDQGKWPKLAGDVTAKTSHPSHEDIILPAGREQAPLPADILSVAAKGADFHAGKTTMDTSKSIYQSVVDQIQDSFSLAQNKDNGQVRLTLKPEIMGHLDMQIAVRNETVQIMMTVENEKVHQAMNAHIDDLKTALQNQGLKIDKIEVTLQNQPDPERSFYQDQANTRFNNPGQNSHQERMLNQELFLGDEHYPKSGQEIIKTQNSMEGVSIFA
ncbi:MAG: flagellar hook-length control protein FliK [Deltaproteobacteria bacterium]|nr:flagellar hook-length control protein FliK [Deltaproteobacteria bacterium]